jgi:cell division protein FtsB
MIESNSNSNDRWMQLVAGIAMSLIGYLLWNSVQVTTQMVGLQSQIQLISQVQSNVIPPVIESSLKELRDKTNADRDLIAKLTEIATGNSRDIGYLKERKP